MDRNEALNKVFEQAHTGLDMLGGMLMGVVDEALSKADNFLEEVEAEVRRRVAQAEGSGENVKVEPSVEQMRADLKAHRAASHGGRSDASVWDSPHITNSSVREYWSNLPDSAKTWDTKDKNSPI